jgi:hypothetical protein
MSDVEKDIKKNNEQPAAVETTVPAQEDESPANILSDAEGVQKNAGASIVAATGTKGRAEIDPSRKR